MLWCRGRLCLDAVCQLNCPRWTVCAPDVRLARTILEFNCDRLVRAFHQKPGMDPSLASRFVVDNREP